MNPLPKPLPCPVCRKEPKSTVHKIDREIVWATVICEAGIKSSGHRVEAAAVLPRAAINRWNRMVKS